jgi:hypothetical protein
MSKKQILISDTFINSKIYIIRNQKVMLDYDLAELYDVETKRLKEAVRRNFTRFPEDFMFELTKDEFDSLRTQIASSKKGRGGARYEPMAFTEQGVTMLSCILNSERAIDVNIRIIRVFTKMREMLLSQKEILLKIDQIERKITGHDEDIQVIFQYLKQLLNPPDEPRKQIGFKSGKRE